MKASKTLLVALIGGLVSTASHAQVELDITGGQTFKSAVINRVYTIFDGGAANTASNAVDTSHITFSGTASGALGGNPTSVVVRLGFTTTGQGLIDLAESNLVGFARSIPEGGGSVLISNPANVAFSDIFPGTATPPQNAALFNEQIIGVVPFVFVGHNDLAFSNLTREAAISFWEFSGQITEDFFVTNGNPSKIIYDIARTPDSGTRIVSEKVAAFVGTPQVYNAQYQPTNGYTTSSSQVGAIANTPNSLGVAGIADYLASGNPGASTFLLKYEGYAPTPTNVVLGLYPVWSYDHAYTLKTGPHAVSGLQSNLFQALASALTNDTYQTTNPNYTNSFVALSHMAVDRQGDGTVIIPGQ